MACRGPPPTRTPHRTRPRRSRNAGSADRPAGGGTTRRADRQSHCEHTLQKPPHRTKTAAHRTHHTPSARAKRARDRTRLGGGRHLAANRSAPPHKGLPDACHQRRTPHTAHRKLPPQAKRRRCATDRPGTDDEGRSTPKVTASPQTAPPSIPPHHRRTAAARGHRRKPWAHTGQRQGSRHAARRTPQADTAKRSTHRAGSDEELI